MHRSRISITSLAIGALLGFSLVAAGPAVAKGVSSMVRGGGDAGSVSEPRFIFKTNKGEPRSIEVERALLKIPTEYGEPFAVTSQDGKRIVWYRHPTLGVRNVIILQNQLVHVLQVENKVKKSELSETGTR